MKLIEIIAPAEHSTTIQGIAEHFEVRNFTLGVISDDGRITCRMLVQDEKRQRVMDALQGALTTIEMAHIIVIPVDAALPRLVAEEDESEEKRQAATREELYSDVAKGSHLDGNFLLLVFLSTIVATIGLIENNVAVVIGAMVIAPLLGPNIALALGTSLGDSELIGKALKSLSSGLMFAIGLAWLMAILWPVAMDSHELLSRTTVKLDSIALALASGAAAVLSLTTGLSSVLVGVMVAVALLPPAVTIGLMLGTGQTALAEGAALLLAVNVVSVNLSAKLVLLYRGIKPRTWGEKKKAKLNTILYLLFWFISLAVLVVVVYSKGEKLLGG
ncbi:MAG: TIGR00341 family protein [Gammaproteobacteria bacterium]|nr:TIGR00341 family protein [Gammaproteobacteria bacterium]